jgi:TATA-box binding protein (TBP) (component of TFIID and TFIIIB)
VKFLIKEKANCDLKNLIGSTALDEALNLELSDLIVKKKYKDKKYTFNLLINVI